MGKERDVWDEKCCLLSEITSLYYIFMAVWCVFCYQSVCLFYQWCFYKVDYQVFHHNNICRWLLLTAVCVNGFCEIVLVKQNHTLPMVVWFEFSFPKCYSLKLVFLWYCINSLVSLEMPQIQSWGCCPQAFTRADAPQNPQHCVLKKLGPCQLFFAVHTSPQCYSSLYWN